MYKQDDIEELLLQECKNKVREIADKIMNILSNDRNIAYTAASNGTVYKYTEHLMEVPKGLSPFRVIREVQELLERRYPTEVSYLTIKQVTVYSRNGVLSLRRTWRGKKVSAVSFRWNRREVK